MENRWRIYYCAEKSAWIIEHYKSDAEIAKGKIFAIIDHQNGSWVIYFPTIQSHHHHLFSTLDEAINIACRSSYILWKAKLIEWYFGSKNK